MSGPTILRRVWWAEIGQNVIRQWLQVAGPTLTVLAAGGLAGVEWPAFAATLVAAALVTVGRAFTGLRADGAAAGWAQALDRGAAAAVGAALGLGGAALEVAAVGDWPGFLTALGALDGRAVLAAALASASIAVIHHQADPPTKVLAHPPKETS
jgi:hypothetical protein